LLVQLGYLQEQAGIHELKDESDFSVSDKTHNSGWDDNADEFGAEDKNASEGNRQGSASYANNMPAIDDPTYSENCILILSSNKNADQTYSSVELPVRQNQAKSELNFLQDLIAEKSFQFSGVIRVGRKQMKLRSRNLLRQMNHEIAIHCKVYNRCRNKMIRLHTDKTMLEEHFKVLTKEDIKTNTAILDPNRPGSTQPKLSWIWHTVRTCILPPRAPNLSPATTQHDDPATSLECKGLFSNTDFPINPHKCNTEGVTDLRDSVTDCIQVRHNSARNTQTTFKSLFCPIFNTLKPDKAKYGTLLHSYMRFYWF